jgi:methylated-DNA-protein-cysteine methyltransferase-like protein
MKVDEPAYQKRVYDLVRRIPKGKVMTYGSVAVILGEGYTPRTVGHVMRDSPRNVPWQRVINSQGKCSTGRIILPVNLQQQILEKEGVKFSKAGRCDLTLYQWWPEDFANDEQTDLFEATDKHR